jgi:hypothetical protein
MLSQIKIDRIGNKKYELLKDIKYNEYIMESAIELYIKEVI